MIQNLYYVTLLIVDNDDQPFQEQLIIKTSLPIEDIDDLSLNGINFLKAFETFFKNCHVSTILDWYQMDDTFKGTADLTID